MSYEYDDVDAGANNLLWGRLAALGVFAVLIFSLGYCAAPNGVAPEELAAREAEIAELQQVNEQLQGAIDSRPSESPGSTGGSESPSTGGSEDATSGTGNERTYEVVSGDTLSRIAGKVYDDPTKFPLIVEANDLEANEPINVGETLIIPPDPDEAGGTGTDASEAGDEPSESG